MMDEGYVDVPCQRCGASGGLAAHGWAILCAKCKANDDGEWFDAA